MNKTNKPYRYLHVIAQGGIGFLENLVELFHDDGIKTNISEHLFITTSERLYDDIHKQCNAILVDVDEYHMIVNYEQYADIIFVHGFHMAYYQILCIPHRIAKKIVWRTWGHDVIIPDRHESSIIKYVLKLVQFRLFSHKVRQFKSIGIANIIDEIKVKKAFGPNIKTLIMSYSVPPSVAKPRNQDLAKLVADTKTCDVLRVMVGHSGFPVDNQLSILNSLAKFRNENIMISLPLVYGNPEYIEQVKARAYAIFGDKCEIIDQKVPFIEYARYLNSVDIAVMDMDHSAALGNISLLLYFRKKIFLNRNGDIAAGFLKEGLDYDCVDKIASMQFDDFVAPVQYNDVLIRKWTIHYYESSYGVDTWNKVFEILQGGNR